MAHASSSQGRQRLEQELQSDRYQELIRKLQRQEPFLRRFKTWADVVALMRNGVSQDSRKDDVLRPILQAHSEDKDPRWRTILLVMFWPGLEAIHWQKRGWDPDPDERWQNIMWTFLEVVCRLDVQKRPFRLVQKVINDTAHRLHDQYRRVWNRTTCESSMASDELDVLGACVDDIDFGGIELREAQEAEIKRLREHWEAGTISEADFLLLVGTRVYGQSVADYARDAGLGYQAAKKRRQRAEAAIRRFEEKSARLLSPS